MAKSIKARSNLGINTIMDSVMVPDGFSRVCDGLDTRSGAPRTWQLPSLYRDLSSVSTKCIWEFMGKWYESDLQRAYHGEYLYGLSTVYFTEEGINNSPPQKIVGSVQARLGIQRPSAMPIVSASGNRYPGLVTGSVTVSGGVQPPVVSYRIAATKGGVIIAAGSPTKVTVTVPSTIALSWRKVPGADGYAVFGRTPGSEKLLIMLGDVSSWTDDGTSQEGFEAASSYDSTTSMQYVYTYFRKVGTVEDESGPSPLSIATVAGTTPVITRQPTYDGLYSYGATVYQLGTNTLTSVLIATPYLVTSDSKQYLDKAIVVTSVAHGLVAGDIGRFLAGGSPDVDYAVSLPVALSVPTLALNADVPFPAGGTVSVGSHIYKFTAMRGSTIAGFFNPAQTTAATVNVAVVGVPSSVRFTIGAVSGETDGIIAYRDGSPVAMIDPSAVATWTDTGGPTIGIATIPATNETATRCFWVQGTPSVGYSGDFLGGQFWLSKIDITVGGLPSFAPSVGDIISLNGLTTLPQLNGSSKVLAFNSGTGVATLSRFCMNVGTETTGTLSWLAGNGSYAGWRIYRVGDTPEFLRVAELAMDVETYTDFVPTSALGDAIPTAYTSNGLQVVFDWAPENLKRMVTHYGIRFGIVDNVVRWTPANQPDAWPDVYSATFPSRPVALRGFRNILAVLCEDGLYGLIGNTPSTMSPAGPFSNLGCVAPFSVQASNRGLLWLSKGGIAVSLDGVSAQLLASDKISPSFFLAPSTATFADGVPIGDNWYLPATQTVQFAESMRNERVNSSLFPVSEVAQDLPIHQEILDIKSFYWDDRYVLYYTGTERYARSGCICVDMSREDMPVTTLPIKPTAVHVSLGGDCFMLLHKYEPTPVLTFTDKYASPLQPTSWFGFPDVIAGALQIDADAWDALSPEPAFINCSSNVPGSWSIVEATLTAKRQVTGVASTSTLYDIATNQRLNPRATSSVFTIAPSGDNLSATITAKAYDPLVLSTHSVWVFSNGEYVDITVQCGAATQVIRVFGATY